MASHVDIIRNEPLAGSSYRLARVSRNGDPGLQVEAFGETDEDIMWAYLCSRVQSDPGQEPDAFLQALRDAIDSTYVSATRVHEDDECEFVHTPHPAQQA
jgi:hypothetical protein